MAKDEQTELLSIVAFYSLVEHIKTTKPDLTMKATQHLNNISEGIEWYFLPSLTQFSPDDTENTISKAIEITMGSLSNTGVLPSIETMIKLINGEKTTSDDFSSNTSSGDYCMECNKIATKDCEYH